MEQTYNKTKAAEIYFIRNNKLYRIFELIDSYRINCKQFRYDMLIVAEVKKAVFEHDDFEKDNLEIDIDNKAVEYLKQNCTVASNDKIDLLLYNPNKLLELNNIDKTDLEYIYDDYNFGTSWTYGNIEYYDLLEYKKNIDNAELAFATEISDAVLKD